MKKILIVYYSWSNGNTKRVAEMLQQKTNADITRIDTVLQYKGSYDEVVNQGQEEVNRGYCPEINLLDKNVEEYDVIAIGTPTWWYTMAPAVHTFLKNNDFKGKMVIPFMTNGGWPGHVIDDMKKACKNAEIAYPIEVKFDSEGGANMETPQLVIDEWIESIIEILK